MTLSEGLVAIGHRMFFNCDSFARVTLPEGITVLGEGFKMPGASLGKDFSIYGLLAF